MTIQSQIDIYEKIWKKFRTIITEGKVQPLNKDLVYMGKKFFAESNSPLIVVIAPVSPNLWPEIQQIQAKFERIDSRQQSFHPIYFHITLIEFGWEDQINLKDMTVKVKELLSEISPFKLEIRGLNCFEYMIYAQVFDEEQVLLRIYELMYNRFPLIPKRFPVFIPHISITEIKTNEAKSLIEKIEQQYRETDIGTMIVEEIQIVAARPYLTVGALEVIERFTLI
jgi:2'-5' RNA ligase